MNIIIRPYRRNDCEHLAKLFYDTVHTINQRDYTKAQLNAWANGNVDLSAWHKSFKQHYCLVAVDKEKNIIVGFGDISKDGYFDRLFVHANYQRQKIAMRLCDELEKLVKGKKIFANVSITAKEFFLKRGYKIVRKQIVQRDNISLVNYRMEK